MRRALSLAIGLWASVTTATVSQGRARAAFPDQTGTRALGMGGALRGAATGDAGPALNPSGMSLVHSYVIEGAYQYGNEPASNTAHVSIVDSTSASNIAGGVYYTYLSRKGPASMTTAGHEAGLSLGLPLGERLSLGATVKYARLTTDAGSGTPSDGLKGVTYDLGATLKPASMVSLGAVGYNLRDLHNPLFPVALGGGIAITVVTNLLLGLDAVKQVSARTGTKSALGWMGGAEWVISAYALRAGGGHDGFRDNGFVTGGLTLLSEVGALDLGLRQDVSGTTRETFFGISGRLFVPAP